MWYIVYDVYSKRYFVDIGVRRMLTKAICYIKARYRVHQMLKRYPTLKQAASKREVESIIEGVAKHLYRQRKNKRKETDEDLTIDKYCRRCKNANRWDYGKQTVCDISQATVSKYRTRECENFKEDVKKC